MKFIDQTQIFIKAGHGGPGMVSFAAAFGAPKLGPDGGNGGNGGSVFLEGTSGLNTLGTLRYKQTYKADDGGKGGSNGRTGANGNDRIIPVPLGSVIFNAETGDKIGEVLTDGEMFKVAQGGWRGFGNTSFVSSTHQRPHESTPGKPGEEFSIKLELKLLADVGLAGFPNAGKSTLLSKMSSAKPKIAGYPFTTLTPNLGVVDVSSDVDERSFVIADVPGLIEGAAEGKGLGHAFLKHLERTKVVLHVIDGCDYMEVEPIDALEKLRDELERYSEKLASKRILVAINKTDLLEDPTDYEKLEKPIREAGYEVLGISAVKSDGLNALKKKLYDILLEEKLDDDEEQEIDMKLESEISEINEDLSQSLDADPNALSKKAQNTLDLLLS
jgi:GTP-binding protein